MITFQARKRAPAFPDCQQFSRKYPRLFPDLPWNHDLPSHSLTFQFSGIPDDVSEHVRHHILVHNA